MVVVYSEPPFPVETIYIETVDFPSTTVREPKIPLPPPNLRTRSTKFLTLAMITRMSGCRLSEKTRGKKWMREEDYSSDEEDESETLRKYPQRGSSSVSESSFPSK